MIESRRPNDKIRKTRMMNSWSPRISQRVAIRRKRGYQNPRRLLFIFLNMLTFKRQILHFHRWSMVASVEKLLLCEGHHYLVCKLSAHNEMDRFRIRPYYESHKYFTWTLVSVSSSSINMAHFFRIIIQENGGYKKNVLNCIKTWLFICVCWGEGGPLVVIQILKLLDNTFNRPLSLV